MTFPNAYGSETDFIIALQNDDPDAWSLFYDFYVPHIKRRICNKLQYVPEVDHVAGDLSQEVVWKTYMYRLRIDKSRPLWPWVATITDRVIVDWQRHQNSDKQGGKETVVSVSQLPPNDSGVSEFDTADFREKNPAIQLQNTEMAEEIHQCVLMLPESEREVLELRLSGYSNAEIAEKLGITGNNVAARLSRAKRKLKSNMQERETLVLSNASSHQSYIIFDALTFYSQQIVVAFEVASKGLQRRLLNLSLSETDHAKPFEVFAEGLIDAKPYELVVVNRQFAKQLSKLVDPERLQVCIHSVCDFLGDVIPKEPSQIEEILSRAAQQPDFHLALEYAIDELGIRDVVNSKPKWQVTEPSKIDAGDSSNKDCDPKTIEESLAWTLNYLKQPNAPGNIIRSSRILPDTARTELQRLMNEASFESVLCESKRDEYRKSDKSKRREYRESYCRAYVESVFINQ